jgi:benzylsuccinate CoA-transferase BbsF subunit
LAGFTHITGWPDRDPAGLFGAYTDFIVPHFIVSSLAAALINRKKTGNGIYLDFSQLECAAHFLGPKIMDWATNKREDNRMGNRVPFASPHGVFRCMGEDEWVAISVSTDQQWEGLKRAMGNPGWMEEERLSLFSARKEKEDDLEKLVEAWTINHTSKEVMELLQKEGVPAGSVLKNRDVYDDPQLSYREQFKTLSHPEIGNYPAEGPPFKFSRTPARLERPAPCLGEHTFGVCTEFLGISDEEFSQLMAEGVLE